jgi:hypothetical protein
MPKMPEAKIFALKLIKKANFSQKALLELGKLLRQGKSFSLDSADNKRTILIMLMAFHQFSKISLIKQLLVISAGLVMAYTFCPAAYADYIDNFDVALHLTKDGTLDIVEKIEVIFEQKRHGIFRKIPTSFDIAGQSGNLDLKVKDVLIDDDQKVNYKVTDNDNQIKIKIGDPNKEINGCHEYRIHYQVKQAAIFADGSPQIYWNVTGNDWPYRIEEVDAYFYPPDGVNVKLCRNTSYVGYKGSKTKGNSEISNGDSIGEDDAQSIHFSADDLKKGEGLTIVVGLPEDSVYVPSEREREWKKIVYFLPAILIPLAATIIMFFLWLKHGIDQGGGGAVGVEWDVPKGLSPAEVGTLIDEKCDTEDIVSTIVDLAVRGYLRIEQIESTELIFFKHKDYIFHRLNSDVQGLEYYESVMLNALFGSGNTVKLSYLKEKFYTHVPTIRDSIYDTLTKKQYFLEDPEKVRKKYIIIGGAIAFIGIFACGILGAFFNSDKLFMPIYIGCGIAFPIIAIFGNYMPARSFKGSKALRECKGFRRFVQMAEKPRIEKLAKDDPTIFGRLLPYAMVLGAGDRWAKAFADIIK